VCRRAGGVGWPLLEADIGRANAGEVLVKMVTGAVETKQLAGNDQAIHFCDDIQMMKSTRRDSERFVRKSRRQCDVPSSQIIPISLK